MKLRPAGPADIQTLAALNRQLLDDEGHPSSASVAELIETHRDWLAADAWSQDILEVDGTVVGYIVHGINPYPLDPQVPERFIRQFSIDRPYRRNGLGRDAFELFLETRMEPGGRLTLDVLESNPAGLAFWKAVGCRPFFHRMEVFRPKA